MKKRIAVVGFGAAGIGYVEELKNSEHQLVIFEKSKDVVSSSLSGIRSDGKIFISKEMGGTLDIDVALQKRVVDFYLKKSDVSEDKIEHGVSFGAQNSDFYRRFYVNGFLPVSAEFFHIGTDFLKNVMQNIYEEFSSRENIEFKFKTKVVDVINNETENSVTVVYIDIESGETVSEIFDKAVIGVGRSGHKLVENIKTREPKILLSSTTVDLGVRFELPNHIVKEINEEMYEFKVKLKTSAGYEVRTFCNNPSGYVTIEKYNEDEFITVNGHSKVNSKTENTNFAVLVTHSFTHPFNDPVGYGTHISKLSNILAGGKKVILQTYKDFKNSKRTKKLGRVSPTLDSEYYILGDLNLVFPSKTKSAIVEFLEQLNNVIPGVTCPDNLLYGVEVKFYSNVLDNSFFKNISFIGDCSGWSRSITYATCHGIIEAQKELENS